MLLVVIFLVAFCWPFVWHLPQLIERCRSLHSHALQKKRPRLVEVQPSRAADTVEDGNMNRSKWIEKRKARNELVSSQVKKPKRHRGGAIDARGWGAAHYHPQGMTENDHQREIELKNKARVPLGCKRHVNAFSTNKRGGCGV